MHDLDPVFRQFSRSEKMKALIASLGYKKPLPIQSMYIFKQPGIGGEVVPHQDSTFLYTEPHSTTGVWIALEDANKSNGCLWALPGSQKDRVARKFIVEGAGTRFDKEALTYDLSQFVPLEMKAGSLVVLHGALVHLRLFHSPLICMQD
jgi:phytanoyl-CoA hydroxylase